MLCEDIIRLAEELGSCVLSQAEEAVSEARSHAEEAGDDSDVLVYRRNLNRIATAVSTCNTVIGTPDNYHNLAVELARADSVDSACIVLERGLESYPASTDLLSDYLKYGMHCGRFQECEKFYAKLQSIDMRRWTWRAFSFSIDYLSEKLDRGAADNEDALLRDMQKLAHNFVKYMPYDEESYVSKADVARILNNREEEMAFLDEGLNKLKVASRCALRRADIYFEMGDFKKCAELLKRCEKDALQPQLNVNINYVSTLSLLCVVSMGMRDSEIQNLNGSNEYFDNMFDKHTINYMRMMYRQAKELPGRKTTGQILQTVRKMIEIQTGVDISD